MNSQEHSNSLYFEGVGFNISINKQTGKLHLMWKRSDSEYPERELDC
jgi:hypothetical protein